MKRNDLEPFDFVDFGCSSGGSMKFAQTVFGAGRGLGVDVDPAKVIQARALGMQCIEADARRPSLRNDSFRYAMMSHFLEHLPDLESVEKAVLNATAAARELVYIQGPFFEADSYLEGIGLKLFWSDWSGHRCHVRMKHLSSISRRIGLCDPVFLFAHPIVNSNDNALHPLSSPVNQHEYHPDRHGQKPEIVFSDTLFRELVCIIPLCDEVDLESLVDRVAFKKKAVRTTGWPVREHRRHSFWSRFSRWLS